METKRKKPIQQMQKAGIVKSLNDQHSQRCHTEKNATRVPNEVAYGIYECFSSQ